MNAGDTWKERGVRMYTPALVTSTPSQLASQERGLTLVSDHLDIREQVKELNKKIDDTQEQIDKQHTMLTSRYKLTKQLYNNLQTGIINLSGFVNTYTSQL